MWPAHAILGIWEELWARFVEEMRELDRNLRRAMKEESPSFERMRFFATAPGENGEPWLRLPRTFYLEDEGEYFKTDVVPRHNRLLSRACWQVALKKGPSGGLHGGKAGLETEAADSRPVPKSGKLPEGQPKPLLGPQLTGKEAARALDHRPKERKGAKYLCWDHMCHRGCIKPSACPHSHGPSPKWESVDWSVQLQLLRRGGLKGGPVLTEAQVTEQMESIRKTQAQKQKEMAAEGKKVKKVGENETPKESQEAKVGLSPEPVFFSETDPTKPPEEFTEFCPTAQESEMADLLEGPDLGFFQDHHPQEGAREVKIELTKFGEEAAARHSMMKEIEGLGLTAAYQGILHTFLKN